MSRVAERRPYWTSSKGSLLLDGQKVLHLGRARDVSLAQMHELAEMIADALNGKAQPLMEADTTRFKQHRPRMTTSPTPKVRTARRSPHHDQG